MNVDVHLHPGDLERALRDDVRRGLTSVPKELPPKWFYDARGSRLFEEITQLDEYYPTRCEREILHARVDEIAQATGAETLVELGSGTSEKTRSLISALRRHGTLRTFVPFDVSDQVLREAAATIEREFGGLRVHAVVGDFERHLDQIPSDGRRLVAFLGGTIGNFTPAVRERFLKELAATLDRGDYVLIGVDLVKDVARLEAAYNDAAGVTAEFNRNVLRVINDNLDADFHPDAFEHVALFDPDEAWIEMRLRSRERQRVTIGALGLTADFEPAEEMRTEISAKFTAGGIGEELIRAGLDPRRWWTDAGGDFGLALAQAS